MGGCCVGGGHEERPRDQDQASEIPQPQVKMSGRFGGRRYCSAGEIVPNVKGQWYLNVVEEV